MIYAISIEVKRKPRASHSLNYSPERFTSIRRARQVLEARLRKTRGSHYGEIIEIYKDDDGDEVEGRRVYETAWIPALSKVWNLSALS
jgi:hypothetical protein